MKRRLCFAVAMAVFAAAAPSRAGIIITAIETGGDVVITGTGSLDVAGLTPSPADNNALVNPSIGGLVVGPVPFTLNDAYTGVTGPSSFGPGPLALASSGSGDSFGVGAAFEAIVVPAGYLSGTALSANDSYAGATFASLGLTPGTYVYTLGGTGDTLTFQVGGAVPEPSSLALCGLGVAGAAAYARRRKARA